MMLFAAEFRAYFEKYGKVISAEVMFNRETHKSRGFGFIVFELESGAVKVCAEKEHSIDGKVVGTMNRNITVVDHFIHIHRSKSSGPFPGRRLPSLSLLYRQAQPQANPSVLLRQPLLPPPLLASPPPLPLRLLL